MPRILLHALFWFACLAQDTFFQYTWMSSMVDNPDDLREIGMGLKTALVLLPPKLILVYYLLSRGLGLVIHEKKRWLRFAFEFLLVFFVSVTLFRVLFNYVVIPGIYSRIPRASLFSVRNILLAILEIGYVTAIAIAFKLLRMQQKLREREKDLVQEKLNTELKFLRNQVHPHFLFNTMNNIYGLARQRSEKTAESIMKLSEILNFMLYESGKDQIPLADEVRLIEDYLSLEKMRYTERLKIEFNKAIDHSTRSIAPLLLLPLVENAFKHGVSETRFESFVKIDLKLENDWLDFSVKNSIAEKTGKLLNGNIGLKNTRRQLELMYREHSIEVDETRDHFSVLVKINLASYGKI